MDVARRLGINRHTIPRWKKNPLFAAELKRMIDRLTEVALALRPGWRMHHYSLYRAGIKIGPEEQNEIERVTP